jgi:hypothetical protein
MLGTVEEAGGVSAPILVNGTPISVSNKVTAQTEDKDGIRVLHLYGMGVAQDFSKIKANGTHKEMVSSAASSTETKNVADKLYMGVRILPVTAGKLRVYFKKASGGYTGWERDIISDINWQLYQSTDNSDQPWDYTGSGKLIVSYTGECYIRFVALTTNAVANSKEDYSTLFEQNSRHITLRANKISSDLTEAVADFTIKYDSITQTVTNNKSAADRAFQTLTTDLNAETSARQSLENQWHATWVYQNDNLISLMAAQFNSDGTIKGYADLKVQVNNISSNVTSNKQAADQAIGNINSSLGSLWDYAEAIDGEQGATATWVSQNQNKWSAVAAAFNDNGTINTAGRIALYVSNQLSTFSVDADRINFKTGNFTIKNKAGQTTLALDSDGNLTILGTINGGNITGNIGIGSGTNKLYIEPTELGARLVGKTGDTEVLNLGFWTVNGETRCGLRYSTSAYYEKDYFKISGSGGNITGYCNDGVRISHQDNYGTVSFGISSAHKVYIGSSYISQWPTSASSVNVGQVYLDGDGYLKVRRS